MSLPSRLPRRPPTHGSQRRGRHGPLFAPRSHLVASGAGVRMELQRRTYRRLAAAGRAPRELPSCGWPRINALQAPSLPEKSGTPAGTALVQSGRILKRFNDPPLRFAGAVTNEVVRCSRRDARDALKSAPGYVFATAGPSSYNSVRDARIRRSRQAARPQHAPAQTLSVTR